MTMFKVLMMAHDKIRNPKNWTQGALTRHIYDIEGTDEIVSWCAVGAIYALTEEFKITYSQFSDAREFLEKMIQNKSLARFNDQSSHSDVLALFENGMKKAMKELEDDNT